eukprot:1160170-Pelagomonas_calceolata.AAC.6
MLKKVWQFGQQPGHAAYGCDTSLHLQPFPFFFDKIAWNTDSGYEGIEAEPFFFEGGYQALWCCESQVRGVGLLVPVHDCRARALTDVLAH